MRKFSVGNDPLPTRHAPARTSPGPMALDLSVTGAGLERASTAERLGGAKITPPTSATGRYSLLDMAGVGGQAAGRAKCWSPQVEDLYRLQFCGWRDATEYAQTHGEPDRWPRDADGNNFISKVQLKCNGYFTYWRKWRECDDRHVFKVRVFAA